jgi:RNA polymerase sigma-70 factor (ECF subfamily)
MPLRAAAGSSSTETIRDTAGVFGEFQRRLRAFVARRVRNAADVEDVVQETFLRIHRNLAQVRRDERLAAWVFQVARSALADHYRRQRPRTDVSEDREREPSEDPEDAGAAPANELEELAACLTPMIESLPRADREAIELSEIAGLTQRQASSRAGVTLSGMKSRVQRARRKLKAMLLDCCRIELDGRGGVVGHEPHGRGCEPCRPSAAGQRRP